MVARAHPHPADHRRYRTAARRLRAGDRGVGPLRGVAADAVRPRRRDPAVSGAVATRPPRHRRSPCRARRRCSATSWPHARNPVALPDVDAHRAGTLFLLCRRGDPRRTAAAATASTRPRRRPTSTTTGGWAPSWTACNCSTCSPAAGSRRSTPCSSSCWSGVAAAHGRAPAQPAGPPGAGAAQPGPHATPRGDRRRRRRRPRAARAQRIRGNLRLAIDDPSARSEQGRDHEVSAERAICASSATSSSTSPLLSLLIAVAVGKMGYEGTAASSPTVRRACATPRPRSTTRSWPVASSTAPTCAVLHPRRRLLPPRSCRPGNRTCTPR